MIFWAVGGNDPVWGKIPLPACYGALWFCPTLHLFCLQTLQFSPWKMQYIYECIPSSLQSCNSCWMWAGWVGVEDNTGNVKCQLEAPAHAIFRADYFSRRWQAISVSSGGWTNSENKEWVLFSLKSMPPAFALPWTLLGKTTLFSNLNRGLFKGHRRLL